jgi:hypothetical protein
MGVDYHLAECGMYDLSIPQRHVVLIPGVHQIDYLLQGGLATTRRQGESGPRRSVRRWRTEVRKGAEG